MSAMRWIFLVLCFLCLCSGFGSRAGTIYYYCDENGVFHFTDLPASGLYRPFIVFRDKHFDLKKIKHLVRIYSERYGLEPALIQAMIEVESAYEPEAVSKAGAQGLMQIMPNTQKELGLRDPFDPSSNIEAGVRYLRSLLDRFGDLSLALAAYNAGPARVEQYNGIPPYVETRQYVRRVLDIYSRLKR
jgi:soluble lytic murein transglycosylase-like protein